MSPLLEGKALVYTRPPIGLPRWKGAVSNKDQMNEKEATHSVLASRVELASVIAILNVQQGLVNEASDLDITWALDELNALQSSIRNETSSMALLRTPCDFNALAVADASVGCRRSEKAKVWSNGLELFSNGFEPKN